MARNNRRDRRGIAAVEFALWLPVLFFLVAAVVDWGFYMHQKVNVARAAIDGCRMGAAMFEPNDISAGSLSRPAAESRAYEVLNGLGISCGSCVRAQYCSNGSGGACGAPPFDALLIEINYTFTPFFGMANTPTTIQERFMMASENQR